jgi:UDP-GlcNAc3NAcA epimerase
MIKIVTIVGARPQFVKAAALSREFSKYAEIEEVIIHTGQHFDVNMSDVFFVEMQIRNPQYNLNINGLAHGAMTGQMLEGIERILLLELPHFVVVYGDTNSTLAGALAARKLNIKLVHVEAGLRSFNMLMPEEINRILTDRISDILCAPTARAIDNLVKEGYQNFNVQIIDSGDIMQDAAIFYRDKSAEHSTIIEDLRLNGIKFLLVTIHRVENTDDIEKLKSIIEALNLINKECLVILPIHPRTKAILVKVGIVVEFTMIEPVGYFDMIQLIINCQLVLTDSGGIQKEAYFFDKFVITLREETEWVELIDNNYSRLTGSNKEKILEAFNYFFDRPFVKLSQLYGGGSAARLITQTLLNFPLSQNNSATI